MSLGDDEIVHVAGDALARKLEIGQGGRHLLAADELRDEIELLRAHPQHAGDRFRLVLGERALACLFAHVRPQPCEPPPGPAAVGAAAGAAAAPGVAGPAARFALRSDEWP